MKHLLVLFTLFSFSNVTFAQTVSVGTTTPDPNAILDINSIGKPILLPRLSSATITGLPAKDGMIAYDVDKQNFVGVKGKTGTTVTSYTSPTNSFAMTATSIAAQTYTAPSTFTIRDFSAYLVSGSTSTILP